MTHPPRRVRVTHPRTEAARRVPARPVIHESLTAAVLAGTALLGALAPGFARMRLFGVAAPWLVLGVLIYPAMIVLAAYAVRHAERNERDFTELVNRR